MVKKVYYTYHWNRIFGAIAALLLLIGAVYYAVNGLIESENPERAEIPPIATEQESAVADHAQPQEDEAPPNVTDNQQPAPPGTPEIDPSPQKPIQPSIEQTQVQPVITAEVGSPATEVEHDSPSPAADTKQPALPHEQVEKDVSGPETIQTSQPDQPQSGPETIQPPLPDQPQPGAQIVPDSPASVKQVESATADIPQDDGSNTTFHLQEINKFSSSVKRFTLAQAIKEREPVGTIGSITMDDKGIAVVYAFSEVTQMRDRTFYYYWFYKGKQVAKVPVVVGNDSWRSYSSKYITEKKRGAWAVELHTDDGEILASAKFYW